MEKESIQFIYKYRITDKDTNKMHRFQFNVFITKQDEGYLVSCDQLSDTFVVKEIVEAKREFDELIHSKITDAISGGYIKELIEIFESNI